MSFDKVNRIFLEIRNFTTLEIAELIIQLEQIFGSSHIDINENTPIEKITETIEQEKTSINVNVIIKTIPTDKKITILKVVRLITGLGLKESKAIVDNVPQIVKENISKDEALQIQKDLETAGAEILIEPIKIKN